jgi:hypothetical protein
MGRSGTITPLAPVRSRKWPVWPALRLPDRSNRRLKWRHQRAHARSREGGRREPSFAAHGLPHAFVCPDRAWRGRGGSGRHRRAFGGSCAKHSASGCEGTQSACRRGSGRAGAVATESEHEKHSAGRGGRRYGDQIAQMSDQRERFTSIGSASRSEVKIALRLQLGDPHHTAALGGNKARQQILQRDILRLHGVATDGEFEPGFGELADALR